MGRDLATTTDLCESRVQKMLLLGRDAQLSTCREWGGVGMACLSPHPDTWLLECRSFRWLISLRWLSWWKLIVIRCKHHLALLVSTLTLHATYNKSTNIYKLVNPTFVLFGFLYMVASKPVICLGRPYTLASASSSQCMLCIGCAFHASIVCGSG